MARDLGAYRQYVYDYLDIDNEDIKESLIDFWVAEGHKRILAVVRRWPFYEGQFDVVTVAGQREYDVPAEFEDIRSGDGQWGPLDFIDYSEARDRFHLYGQTVSQGHARAWSFWGGKIQVWPLPDAGETITFVGYKKPALIDPTGGASQVPDMPGEFEDCLQMWVLYEAHLQQDDPERAAPTLQQFQARLDELVSDQFQRPSAYPLIVGGGSGRHRAHTLPSRLPYPWE